MVVESLSSKYWNKISKAKKLVAAKRIPEEKILPIINSKYTYSTKLMMLERIEKEYKITL